MASGPGSFNATQLSVGKTYRVITAFDDYDRQRHPVGETWVYLEKNFLPYEDGLTLRVEQEGRQTVIRLQWRPESQGDIIDRFSDFVAVVGR